MVVKKSKPVLDQVPTNATVCTIKWAVMAAMLLWTIAYRLSLESEQIGGFVYANF